MTLESAGKVRLGFSLVVELDLAAVTNASTSRVFFSNSVNLSVFPYKWLFKAHTITFAMLKIVPQTTHIASVLSFFTSDSLYEGFLSTIH